jgi:hypothetical protein
MQLQGSEFYVFAPLRALICVNSRFLFAALLISVKDIINYVVIALLA